MTLAERLAKLTRHPIPFNDLCDKLGLPPGKVVALAKKHRVKLDSSDNGHVQLPGREQIRTVQDSRILPSTGGRQQIGVISDLHVGSKYCLRSQIVDCVTKMYVVGVRDILIPGDLLDGCYKHGVFELSHTGLTDQATELCAVLPKRVGLRYHAITGNHDHTFTEQTGVDVGEYITGVFHRHRRNDIQFYGNCGAFIRIRGAIVHMWHPLGGASYAKSYKLQKQIEKYGAGEKPQILLCGHLHQFAYVEDRGVFALLCPTFQASGSAFSKRLGGQPALGGLILSWEVAGKDLIRQFAVERVRYFEVELPTRTRR